MINLIPYWIYRRFLIAKVWFALWSLDKAIKKYQKGCWDTEELEKERNANLAE